RTRRADGPAGKPAGEERKRRGEKGERRREAEGTTRADCESLGIGIGDFVAGDPRPEGTESGNRRARHLEDKAGVAALRAALKSIVDSGAEPLIDCHPLFTNTEETGTGAAGVLPWDVSEVVGIDIRPVAPGQHSSGHAVSVAMRGTGGTSVYHLSRHLLLLGVDNDLPVRP
ncbi:osmoprotectant NAGGN system M42 family peptidase, partial [Pseudomonas syringae]